MDYGNLAYYIVLLLMLSAFFSGSETALFSLDRINLKRIENSERKTDKRILILLRKPRLLLITILLGNTFVNIAISSFTTLYIIHLNDTFRTSESVLLTVQIIITTIVILIVGEILPKLLAWARSHRIAQLVSFPLYCLEYLLWPILKVLELFSFMISRSKSLSIEQKLTSDEFHTLLHSDKQFHTLKEHEKKMLSVLFRFPKTEVRELITPRVEISALEINKSTDDLVHLMISSGYSRIPIYKKNIDNIIGVVYLKDILLYPHKKTIKELLRPAEFVTENMKIQTLLNQFKSQKSQIAIVVDEYGSTSGIVSLEDILEELVGEINDEYDQVKSPDFIWLTDDTLEISGSYSIRELNTQLGIELNPEEYDNIADFLLEEFNHVPRVNEQYTYQDKLDFIIKDSSKRRINRILIKIHNTQIQDKG